MTRFLAPLAATLALALVACAPQAAEPEQTTAPAPAVEPKPATEAAESEDALPVAEGQAKLTLAIDGMHCGGCAAGVDGRIRKVAGVADCTVDFETGKAVIVYDPESTAPEALAAASIDGTNYTAQVLP